MSDKLSVALCIALRVRQVSRCWRGFYVQQSVDTWWVEVSRPLALSDGGPDTSISKVAEEELHYGGLTPGCGNLQGV
jgi:hypothetical protein